MAEADAGTLLDIALDAPFNLGADDEIIVQILDIDENVNFRIGQNTGGETAPSYLTSDGCSITVPTPTEDIGGGFPDDFVLNIVVDTALGLEDNVVDAISVYPNPAQDVINLDITNNFKVASVNVYDVVGKKTNLTLTGSAINIAKLASGLYILEVTTDTGSVGTYKIVKQ